VLDFVCVVVYMLVGSRPSRIWYKSSDSFPTLERSTAISTNFFSELDSQTLPDLQPRCTHRSLSCLLVSEYLSPKRPISQHVALAPLSRLCCTVLLYCWRSAGRMRRD